MSKRAGDWWQEYVPFVNRTTGKVVRDYYGRVDAEELRQSGMLALVEAGTRFDPEREATFAGYVRLRVIGAIRDAARRESMRKQRGQFARSFEGQSEEAHRMRQVSSDVLDSPFVPLERARYTTAPDGGRRSMESEVLYRDFVRSLRARLEELPERERTSVESCDLEGLSFVRAGEKMGCTGGGVFRMRQRALGRLRACLCCSDG